MNNFTANETTNEVFIFLQENFDFPFEITGIEDFNWEEYYIFGSGDPEIYNELKKNQPSYKDIFNAIRVKNNIYSEWVIESKDFLVEAQRNSDGKIFYLGLSEIKLVNQNTKNQHLLNNYMDWFFENL